MPPELPLGQPPTTDASASTGPNRPWVRWLVLIVAGIILLAGIGYGASRLIDIVKTPKASPTPSPAPPVTAEERSKVADPKVSSSQLTVTSLNADNADIIDLVVKALRVSTDTALDGRLTVGGTGTFGGAITAANFQGSGAGLTNVNAALLNGQSGAFYQNLANATGVLGVNQLPTDVALRNSPNTFAAANTFTSSVTAASLALGAPLGLASGGLGLTSVANQGVLYGTTGGTLGVATPAGTGLCLLSGATDLTWGACTGGSTVTSLNGLTGALTIAGASAAGATITLDDATAAAKGIASFNSANFSVTAGAVNTVQDINAAATPTFAGVNTNAITPSAALTIGSVAQTLTMQGSAGSSFSATAGANTTTVDFQAPTASVTYRFLTAAAGTYDICTSAGNCAGSGGVDSLNGLTGPLTIAGASTAGSTITLGDATAAAKGIASFSATNFSVTAGNVDTIQDIATSASPTFAGINTNSINPTAALTVGSTSQSLTLQGSNTTITSTNGANVAALTFVAPTASVTYQLQTAAAGTYDVCTTAGNCVGVGGSVSTSGGSAGTIPKYTSATALGPSLLTDNGTVVTVGGDLSVTGAVTLTNALAVGNGGTGAINASGARSNLGAAAAGSNSDITALTGLTTALTVAQGGTGAISLTAGGVLLGNGTSPISAITGSNGDCLVVASGVPTFQSCPGSGSVSNLNGLTGALTIANATTGGSTITLNNAAADGATKGIAAFNATNFSAASGIVNTIQNIDTAATPTFAGITSTGTAAVQGASLTIGTALGTDGALVLQNATNSFTLALNAPAQTVGSATISFPDTAGAGDTVCLLTLSNCVGTGGGVTGSGTTDRLAKFTSGGVIGNSTISDNGSTVTTTGDLVVQGGDATFGTTSQIASLIMHDGNGQTTTLQAGNSTGDLTFVLPTVTGNASDCLKQSGTGNQLIWDACDGGGGGSTATLQTAYVNGNSISTTGNDIAFTLNSSQNLTVTTAAGATGSTTFALTDGANTTPPAQLVLVANNDTNQAVANGITIAAAAGGLTNGLNVSDSDITNAVNVGDNTILGTLAVIDFTNFDVDASGNVTAGSLTLGTPLATTSGGTGANTTQGAINNISQLTTNGDLLYNNGTNSTRLARGNNGECLTANATTILWASCGLSGDSISVNGAAASDADFIDTTATGTTAGVAWNLNTATSPDSLSLTVSSASATQAGVVTNTTQTFAGDKTFTGNIIAGANTTLSDHNLTSTGALNLTSGGSSDLSLQGAGAVNIGLGGGSNINIGTNAAVHTIGIGTGAADNDVTIGSTTAGSTLTLNSAGTITLGAATLQRTAAGFTNINLLDSSADTTLLIQNSDGTRVANLNVEGSLFLGTALGTVYGGTGATSSQGAINNLSQLTTNGDLLYNDGTNSTRLARGSNGQCLTSNTTTIAWGGCGAASTLQGAYDADVDGSDAVIALTAADDGLIVRNPASAGSDSTYILTVEQLNTSATGCGGSVCGGLDIQSAGTGNLFRVRDTTATAADVLTIADGGATTFKSQTNSTTAFQVQNSAASSLFTIDTAGSNISLLGNNDSKLSTWTTTTGINTSSTNRPRARGGAVAANGYLYQIGGLDSTTATVGDVFYAKLGVDGTVGTWAQTTTLNDGSSATRRQFQPVVAGGYMYVIGGRDNSNATKNTSLYAKLNSDGTVGTWNTTTVLPAGRFGGATTAYNGYMFYIGGWDSTPTTQSTVLSAKINPDGTLGSWTTLGQTVISGGLANMNAVVANGTVYLAGGFMGTGSVTTERIFHAALNADGTTGVWSNQTSLLPSGDENLLDYVSNGYLYVIGGDPGTVVYSFALNSDGSVATGTSLTAFPVAVGEAGFAQANGYFYVVGGSPSADGGGTIRNSVYYASTSRLKVGGNLDLVGYSGENLAEGRSGGMLTAGNTIVDGTLQVQDAANFVRNASIGGSLSVSDNASFGSNLTISGPTSNILANGTATSTTGTTEATARTNVTTVTLTAAGSFANNDVIFLNNAGQDYYTRIVSGGGTTTLTVSPAVSYDVSTPVTKYNIQNIGATSTDYTTLSQRFFQGYFLGGVVTGTGSTTLSDGLLRSTNNLAIDAAGGTVTINGNLSLQGGTGVLTVGTSSQAGSIVVNDGNGQKATITVGDLAADRALTIPVATGSDTFCLQTLANCAGGSGANTSLSNLAATAINANLNFAAADRTVSIAQAASGAGNALTIAGGQGASGQTGGNLLLQAGANGTGSGTPGSVIVKANGGNSTTAFQVQNASGVALIAADTTTQTLKVRAGSDTATESGTNIYSGNNFATQWTNTGWDTSITNKARHNTGNTNSITNTTVAITAGATYDLTFSLDGTCPIGESVTITMGGVTVGTINGNGFCTGSYEYAVTTVNTTKLSFTPTSGWNGRFSALAASTVTGATNSALTIQNSSGAANIEVRASSNTSSTYIGLNSGSLNDATVGTNNTALGANALKNNIFGNQNTAVGTNALQSNVGGIENTAVGVSALLNNQTGADNTAIGFQSLLNVTTGYSNTGLGYGALSNTATGHENIGIGVSAGSSILTGQLNTFIGNSAGSSDSDGFTSGKDLFNSTAIGYAAQVQADSSLVLGGQGSNAVNVGIGTTVPLNTLSVMPVDFTQTAGTAWQSGTTISGSGTSWTSAAVGEQIVFSTGETATITGFTNSTTLTAGTSQTVSASTGISYRLHYPGLQVTNSGTLGIGVVSPTAKLEVVGDIVSKGTEWTSRTSAADNTWTSVAYGNGLFVAVSDTGTGNRVMTSPDGINWTSRTSAANNDWQSVAYGNGLFVAVSDTGTGNRIMTSPDGITWTSRTSAADNSWFGVTYGNGTFVAVAANGTNRVMTSPDGITWTARSAAVANQWTAVTYGNSQFVAVANTGTGNRVMTSPDGTTWTARTSSDDNQWTSVTYGNGLYVATAITGSNNNRVMTSPDGITWTGRTVIANSWSSVTYGNGLYVVVSQSGTGNRVMTSLDGINWSIRANPVDITFTGVAYGNGTFAAVAQSGTGNRVMTSGRADYIPTSNNNTFQGGITVNGSFTVNGVIQSTASTALTLQTTTSGDINLKPAGSSNVVIGTSDTTGTLLVLDTKTGTGDPTGTNGGMYYNSAYHEFRCYRDSSWEPCGINPIDRGFVFEDDFIGGTTSTNGAIGQLGWTRQDIGNGTLNNYEYNTGINPTADHPGIFRMNPNGTGSPATNNGATLTLGTSSNPASMALAANEVLKTTVAVGSSTNTSQIMRVGTHNQTSSTGQPTTGVWWEADPASSANWRYCYTDGTPTPQCTASSVAITADTWVRLEIRITALGAGTSAATFVINGTAANVSSTTINTTNLVAPAITCYAVPASTQHCYVDYFQLRGITSAAR